MSEGFRFTYRTRTEFSDKVEVHVRVATIGRTSHGCDLRVERVDDDERIHCADGQVTVVGVDGYGAQSRPSPMPAELRRQIETFEGLG